MLAGDFLRNSAAHAPNRVALIGSGQRLTYAEFDEQADRLANALIDLRLERGAKVAVLSCNRPEYAIAYFGIARTPYVSVHCSTRSTASELTYVLNKTETQLLFIDAGFASLLDSVLPALDRSLPVVLLDAQHKERPIVAGGVYLDQFIGTASANPPDVVLDDSDALAITLTGGTTGLPKAVLVSHKARCASAIAAAEDFGLTDEDVMLVCTPLFHTAGLFVWFGTAVMLGATVVLSEGWDPDQFMRIVAREKVTAAFLVPSQLNHLISHPGFSTRLLKTLRNIGYAGAPMSPALFDRVESALPDVAFTENYGQSEACPITIRRPADGDDKRETVGRAACNAEIGIVDQQGNLLPAGATGEIVTRGEQLFDGYFNDPEATAEVFSLPDGWYLTGDVGSLDEDGFLTLVDRSRDMLVSGGENIYPAEIENSLYQHEAVVECAVFGIPDERWGEVPAAHVVLKPGIDVSEEELIDFCAQIVARYKRPRLIRFVQSLPKTAVGKIKKNELRAVYWRDQRKHI
ncbi:MAG: AMP-binding protein [Gammaproteobacteria bacterium]|nr:AMP-binding protein [Gammaproteobacteria bacterium]